MWLIQLIFQQAVSPSVPKWTLIERIIIIIAVAVVVIQHCDDSIKSSEDIENI
ncbi:MAG: hypothetical protein ACLS9K_03720 [Lachnospira eligens]